MIGPQINPNATASRMITAKMSGDAAMMRKNSPAPFAQSFNALSSDMLPILAEPAGFVKG